MMPVSFPSGRSTRLPTVQAGVSGGRIGAIMPRLMQGRALGAITHVRPANPGTKFLLELRAPETQTTARLLSPAAVRCPSRREGAKRLWSGYGPLLVPDEGALSGDVVLWAPPSVVASASVGSAGVGLDCAVEAFALAWPLALSEVGGADATPLSP